MTIIARVSNIPSHDGIKHLCISNVIHYCANPRLVTNVKINDKKLVIIHRFTGLLAQHQKANIRSGVEYRKNLGFSQCH